MEQNLKAAPIEIRKTAACYGIYTGTWKKYDDSVVVIGGQPIKGNTHIKASVNLTNDEIAECSKYTWKVIRQ